MWKKPSRLQTGKQAVHRSNWNVDSDSHTGFDGSINYF